MFKNFFIGLLALMLFENARSQVFKSPSVNLSVQAGYLAIDPSFSNMYPEVSGEFITGEAGLFVGVNYNLRLSRDF